MVNGELFEKNGLPIFKYRPELPAINARLLKAPGLAQFWERLDQFEGKGYARHLIPVQTKSGWSVAYVYEQIDLGT